MLKNVRKCLISLINKIFFKYSKKKSFNFIPNSDLE